MEGHVFLKARATGICRLATLGFAAQHEPQTHGQHTQPIKPGDCILHPPGEAHQIVNTGQADLIYYVVANNAPSDTWHYPDSNKWGCWAPHMERPKIFRIQEISYWDGEE